MTSVALGVFIIFILYVMIWSIRNDKVRSIFDQTGLIKMRGPSATPRKSARRFGLRRRQAAKSRSERTRKRQ
jgi:hypothetical protein